MDENTLAKHFREVAPNVDFCSLRYLHQSERFIGMRQGTMEPPSCKDDGGVMVSVINDGGLGYCATADIGCAGLRRAFKKAQQWAALSAGRSVMDFTVDCFPSHTGEYIYTQSILQYKINMSQNDKDKSNKVQVYLPHSPKLSKHL